MADRSAGPVWSPYIEVLEKRAERAEARLAEALEELERQWEYNHHEHCGNDWPHGGECYWPRPAVLSRVEAEPE